MKTIKIIFLFCFIIPNIIAAPNLKPNYILVGGDNVNVRAKPDINSKITFQLPIGQCVTVLKTTNETVKIGNLIGKWVFIDTHSIQYKNFKSSDDSTSVKGWVFDYYLFYKSKFKKISKFEPSKYAISYGADTYFEITINSDATFIMRDEYQLFGKEVHEKLCKESCGEYKESDPHACYHKGTLYKYKNIIWTKVDNVPNGGDDYYLIDGINLKYISHARYIFGGSTKRME